MDDADGGEGRPRLFDPAHRYLLVGIVSLVTVVATESMAVSTIMPVVEADLGSLWLYGWVFSGFYLGTLVGVVVGGHAVDRRPPVQPMLVGIAVFMVGLALGGLAPSMAVLVAGRVLQGFGAGAVPVVAYVCVSRGLPPVLRPPAFAVMSTAWVIPSLVSPLAAAEVAEAFGWRWVFLGLIPITLLVALVGAPAVRKVGGPARAGAQLDGSAGESSGSAAPIGAVARLACGAVLLLGGLGADVTWIGLPVAVLGVVVGVAPFRSLTPAGTLRASTGLPAAVLTRGVLTYAFFSADAFISLAITAVRGSTTRYAGIVLAASSLTWTAGSWVQARYAQRWGPTRLVRTGGGLLALGAIGLTAALLDAVPLALWLPAAMTTGLGMGMAYPQLSVVTLAEAPAGGEGAATSALQLCDILGVALGTGIAGVIVSTADRSGTDARIALAAVFVLAAFAASQVARLAARLRHDPSADAAPAGAG